MIDDMEILNFHGSSIIFILVGIVLAFIIIFLLFWFFHVKRAEKLEKNVAKVDKDVKDIQKEVEYVRNLFDSHFKTTDKTILDTREERDTWKHRAEELEKKLEEAKQKA